MSGFEIAGLALGIVPIVVEILKSYSVTKSRFRTFTRYTHSISDVQLRYQVAAANFSNNCQLLLQAAADPFGEVPEMIQDAEHAGWQEPSLEGRFRQFLERDHQLCQGIVIKIRDLLRETREMFSALDRDNKVALIQAFNISRKENSYRRILGELDQWNIQLSNLREQRCKMQKRGATSSNVLVRKAAPREFSHIRAASQSLHESLQDSWSCTNVSHMGHQAKLSLNAIAKYETVQLDVVIACQKSVIAACSRLASESPIWLQVRSITTTKTISAPPVPPAPLPSSLNLTRALHTSTHPSPDLTSPPTGKIQRNKLKKRVQFEDPATDVENNKRATKDPSTQSTPTSDPLAQTFAMVNLNTTESVCCHVNTACSNRSSSADSCLGYIEKASTPQCFRLIFYDASRRNSAHSLRPNFNANAEALPASNLLKNLQILQQFTLAHKLATATLQYHSTSWMPVDWSLKDMAYFNNTREPSASTDISQQLASLHLSTKFQWKAPEATIHSKQITDDLKYMYGIRNLFLAKLGVSLIEICSQQEISKLTLSPMPHDVIRARKILIERPPCIEKLGKRYIEIARKCIDCDFSCGDDLNKADLQSAVYTDVVCALEEMIRQWKTFLVM